MNVKRATFFVGLFIICACSLMLQIVESRVLSVVSHYYLAFLSISLAMLGMTVGSLVVYYNRDFFLRARMVNLAWISSLLAICLIVSVVSLTTSVVFPPSKGLVIVVIQWAKLIAALFPPYIFSGMAVSLALCAGPERICVVYFTDMAGAATGCLGSLLLMETTDGVSALLTIAALCALAGAIFSRGADASMREKARLPGWLNRLSRPLPLSLLLAVMALANAAIHPYGLALTFSKEHIEIPQEAAFIRWNPFSRIWVNNAKHKAPKMWGASRAMPAIETDERLINIDGGAGTTMYRFSGELSEVAFLKYDVTNLAYAVRSEGQAAVIGVGGGRDILAAYLSGFRNITGIEINRIFLDLLTKDFRGFNRLVDLPGVKLENDEARSFFAKNGASSKYDLIQMSLIDTWASTSSGAFTLAENGLYTIEAWTIFFNSLKPNGIFTVSRWYSPSDASETGRLVSLAKAALLAVGAEVPKRHIFLASAGNLATLVLSRSPLTAEDITRLGAAADELGFSVLVHPDAPPVVESLKEILDASGPEALETLSARWHMDVTAPDDSRPFFFNQLRISDPAAMKAASWASEGVYQGNLLATLTLLVILLISLVCVLLTVILPAVQSTREVPQKLVWSGTVYFVCIGLAFIYVEMGVIQRLSIFLGHPTYGLSVGLFTIILTTSLGSLLSTWVELKTAKRVVIWSILIVLCLVALPFLFDGLYRLESYILYVRVVIAVILVSPIGLLMGLALPTGLQLSNTIDGRAAPWFWAVNGAAGVLGASGALLMAITFSLHIVIWAAALLYGAAAVAGLQLLAEAKTAACLSVRGQPAG